LVYARGSTEPGNLVRHRSSIHHIIKI
jgi:hypothetical protein